AWAVPGTLVNGFAAPVMVEVKWMAAGLSVNPRTNPARMTQGAFILTASANAPRGAVNVEIVGTGTVKGVGGKEQLLVRRATPKQEIYFPRGGRGLFDLGLQTGCVPDPSDLLSRD